MSEYINTPALDPVSDEQVVERNSQAAASFSDNHSLSEANSLVSASDESIQESTDGTFTGNLEKLLSNENDKALEVKRDITDDEVKKENQQLQAPLNTTDPIVWHDPTYNPGIIIKNVDTDLGEQSMTNAPQSAHKVDGVYVPLVKINQKVIDKSEIIYMELNSKSDNFLPELKLQVVDSNQTITNLNSSGIDSDITIVITAPVNGVYKKIKQTFYVKSVKDVMDNKQHILIYNAVLKIPELFQKYTTAMNYPEENQWPGCSVCKQSEAQKPNSWEMLHYVANYCNLGFASTEKCKDINDRNWRRFNTYDTLQDALISEKEFAGIDEETAIFDWWVDFYGYIVMVNLPWVLNYDIEWKNLAVYAIGGPQPTSDYAKTPTPQAVLMPRTISDSKNSTTFDGSHNLMIKSHKIVTDNSIWSEGTSTSLYIFKPEGAGGYNSVTPIDIQAEENSVAGASSENYATQRIEPVFVDMSGTNKQFKTRLNAKYFKMRRAKQLVVELEKTNLGLQRGTLVNVSLMETNPKNKSAMAANIANTVSKSDSADPAQTKSSEIQRGDTGETSLSHEDLIREPNVEMVNNGLSGLYYIDGVSFKYNNQESQITQTLYLIKKGYWGNYISKEGYYTMDINNSISK